MSNCAKQLSLYKVLILAIPLSFCLTASEPYKEVLTIAGDGVYGFSNGSNLNTKFNMPRGIACDLFSNVYVADTYNDCVRKIDINSQKVTTFAISKSSYDNIGKIALFNKPSGITCDKNGNLYVVDSYNNRICKIDTASKKITIIAGNSFGFADGDGSVAKFWNPYGIVCDNQDNLYITDKLNHRIRKLSLKKDGKTWKVSTIAGTGKAGWLDSADDGLKTQFNYPTGITCDRDGNLYVSDTNNQRIRKINTNGGVTTIAGDGTVGYTNHDNGLKAQFDYPYGITCDSAGNIYVADKINNRIRKIDSLGRVTTAAGDGSCDYADSATCLNAKFYFPHGIACDMADNLYVADSYNNCIRKIVKSYDKSSDELASDMLEMLTIDN